MNLAIIVEIFQTLKNFSQHGCNGCLIKYTMSAVGRFHSMLDNVEQGASR